MSAAVQDQSRAQCAKRIAEPGPAVGARLRIDQRVGQDRNKAEHHRALKPAEAPMTQKPLVFGVKLAAPLLRRLPG